MSAALLAAVLMWTLLLWAGWALVFLASEGAVIGASSGAPADAWARVYFVGYTLVTLGLGAYPPAGPAAQLATTAASLSGLVVLTLAISYILPVLQAAVHRRATAAPLSASSVTTGPGPLPVPRPRACRCPWPSHASLSLRRREGEVADRGGPRPRPARPGNKPRARAPPAAPRRPPPP